ncbi:MAG: hypothetical protein NZ601_03485 [candidate division WOR-3 bacterium]|nr:hypothetical protein [candidate division WOR-3 bacterium]MCX7757426.1 hypothetical protein [candidate division WOR-3 bacterium]MDW7987782.1 hypothetical protein [candidate division WOR-3 bacterium]
MEDAKKETCPYCGNTDLKNYVYVKTGERIRVYVECIRCQKFVARYTLITYTSNKPYDVLLKRLKCLEYASGKKALKELEEYNRQIDEEFAKVKFLAERHTEKTVEEMIKEKYEQESSQGI